MAKDIGSEELSLRHPEGLTVLFFYPKDNTPGCTRESLEFSAALPKFRRLGTRVFGISRDSLAAHARFREKQGLKVDLVSDPDGELCRSFDVIRWKSLYGRKFEGIERSTFVLDARGRILKEWRKVKVDGHVAELLAFLKEQA